MPTTMRLSFALAALASILPGRCLERAFLTGKLLTGASQFSWLFFLASCGLCLISSYTTPPRKIGDWKPRTRGTPAWAVTWSIVYLLAFVAGLGGSALLVLWGA
jgi:hypothetical protein